MNVNIHWMKKLIQKSWGNVSGMPEILQGDQRYMEGMNVPQVLWMDTFRISFPVGTQCKSCWNYDQ